MKNLKISSIYNLVLTIFITILVILFIIILVKGINYDVILKGGTKLVYRVNTKDVNSFYTRLLPLSEKEYFRVEKSSLKSFSTISITISKDFLNKTEVEKIFPNKEYKLISEEIYSTRIGKQFSFKFLIILLSFSILIIISSAFMYRSIGGIKVGISLIATIFANILLQLGFFSLTRAPLGRNFFSYIIFSTIIICFNYLNILAKCTEIEKSAPAGKLSAKVLIDKSINDTLSTSVFSFIAILTVSIVIFLVFFFLNRVSFVGMMHQSTSIILAYINSLLLLPSIWYKLNKNKKF